MKNSKKIPNQNGLTLVEVLLATVILALAVGGFFATIAAVRQPIEDNKKALQATEAGEIILEDLRSKVGIGTAVEFEERTHTVNAKTYQDQGYTFTSASYTVKLQPDGSRKVELDIVY